MIAGSSQKFSNIISVIWQNFKNTIDIILNSEVKHNDQMCTIISVEILKLGVGKLGSDTIKRFYHGANIKSENLEKIGAWVDGVAGKELPLYWLGLGKFLP